MKATKTFLFIIIIIAVLTVIAVFYPVDGLTVRQLTFLFPTAEEILTHKKNDTLNDPEYILRQWERHKTDSIKSELRDTLIYYKEAMVSPTNFYLPDDDHTFFDKFFATVEAAKTEKRTVRILHYGDSQIELDRISYNLRNYFQEKFGGAGPGLLPFYQSIPTRSVNQDFSGEYTVYSLYGEVNTRKDRDYGIMAKSFRIAGDNKFYVSASSNKSNPKQLSQFSHIRLLFNNLTPVLQATLTDRTNKKNYASMHEELGFNVLSWRFEEPISSFLISIQGKADIYGVCVDGDYGVAVDNIPMRGAGGTQFTRMNDSLLALVYQSIDVGMIILQYGGNAVPSLSNAKSVDNYVNRLIEQIHFLKKVYPYAPIIFIGPSDMATSVNGKYMTYRMLPYLVESLKTEIPVAGAAFWNMYEVMGGENSMIAWVRKGWAGSDYVHFTPKGAHSIGEVLVETISDMYDFYQLRKNTDSLYFEEVWNELKNE